MEKPELKRYINKMISPALLKKSKELGISCDDKKQWKGLIKLVKYELTQKYNLSSAEEIKTEMYAKRMISQRDKFIQEDTSEIIENNPSIPANLKGLAKARRRQELSIPNNAEKRIMQYFIKGGYKVIHKMPFVVKNRIHIASMYLPDEKLIVQVLKCRPEAIDYKRNLLKQKRLQKTGNRVIMLSSSQIKHSNSLKMLLA